MLLAIIVGIIAGTTTAIVGIGRNWSVLRVALVAAVVAPIELYIVRLLTEIIVKLCT